MCYNAAELCPGVPTPPATCLPKGIAGAHSSSRSLSITITTPPMCQILCTEPDCHLTSKPDNTIPRVIAAWEFRGLGSGVPWFSGDASDQEGVAWSDSRCAETVRRIAVLTTGQCHTPEWMLAPFLEGRGELQCGLGVEGSRSKGRAAVTLQRDCRGGARAAASASRFSHPLKQTGGRRQEPPVGSFFLTR